MLASAKPEAVAAFGPTDAHRAVVLACAPRGVHVMVEKPLAFDVRDALAMQALAERHHVHLLTNLETTWYPSVHAARALVREGAIGEIRKVVVHDGHRGPKEIGVEPEFLAWLTDPVRNGGGALTDFGCYGANLVTWLMQGEAPQTVTAVTQQVKPAVYPRVDDEATIVLTYPRAQAILQASWNWPVGRKDMEVYGERGYVLAPDRATIRRPPRRAGTGGGAPARGAAVAARRPLRPSGRRRPRRDRGRGGGPVLPRQQRHGRAHPRRGARVGAHRTDGSADGRACAPGGRSLRPDAIAARASRRRRR